MTNDKQLAKSGTSVGRWTAKEHELFVQGMEKHPREWRRIADVVDTRTPSQCRTHAQKCWSEKVPTPKATPPKKRKGVHPRTSPASKLKKRRMAAPNVPNLNLHQMPFQQNQKPVPQEQCGSATCRSVKGCIIGSNLSPTSICDVSLFTDACLAIGECNDTLPEIYGNIDSATEDASPPSSPSTASEDDHEESYLFDDERFDPIQTPTEEVEMQNADTLNDDFALEGNSYLRVLFDEPMAHDQRFAPLW